MTMTKRDYIKQLQNRGLLKMGLAFGIISINLLHHAEIFDYWFDLLACGSKTNSAVIDTSIHFDISERTVFNIIKAMRESIEPQKVKTLVQ